MNNKRKFSKLTIGLALISTLFLASCGQKQEPTATNTDNTTTGTTTTTTSTTTAPTTQNTPATTGGKTSTVASVPAEAQKLGVQPTDATTCPKDAPIKGVVTAKRGNIYHTSKYPDYAKVKPNICFKDSGTAEKAGFKVPS